MARLRADKVKKAEKGRHPDINEDILANWRLIEADFRREYRIDLVSEIRTISWRYFLALLSGLSADSRFMMKLQEKQEQSKDLIDDDEAMALFGSLAS